MTLLSGDPLPHLGRGMRDRYLSWLAGELEPYGLSACVLAPGESSVLRVTNRNRQVRFVACVPAPQKDTWAYVWPYGWALVTDPHAVALIAKAMT